MDVIGTGISELDEVIGGGFYTNSLNLIVGKAGSGKSLFLQNLTVNFLERDIKVNYYNNDDTQYSQLARFVRMGLSSDNSLWLGENKNIVFDDENIVLFDNVDKSTLENINKLYNPIICSIQMGLKNVDSISSPRLVSQCELLISISYHDNEFTLDILKNRFGYHKKIVLKVDPDTLRIIDK